LLLLSFCKKESKEMFVTNINGATVYFEDFSNPKNLEFGEKITVLKLNEDSAEKYEILLDGKKGKVHATKVGEKLPSQIYVKSIFGINSDKIQIPYGKEVTLISSNKKKSELYFNISYQNQELELKAINFTPKKPELYYFVTTRSGLNLREGPGIDKKKIVTLPYQSNGPISEIEPKLFNIQGKNGFWAKVRNENKVGWIFSGFILTSTNGDWEEYLEKEKSENSGGAENNISGDDYHFEPYSLEGKSEDSTEVNSFKNYKISEHIFEAKLEHEKYEKDCGLKNYLSIQSPGESGLIMEYDMNVKNPQSISSGYIFFSGRPCGCCCATSGDKILALSDSGIYKLNYTDSSIAECKTYEVEFLEAISAVDIRIHPKKNILFINREVPICIKKEENTGDYEKFEMNGSKKYFYAFKLKTDSIEKEMLEVSEDEIPQKWKKDWEEAGL
ncbi:MAG: SH3 domain-containing protein, partial [Leptospiraceae bacterium]|nr:SH3 domain-containing protein [Leptospiraceae bacterium]